MAVAIAGQSMHVSRTSSPVVDSRRESYTSTSGGSFQTAPTALSHAGSSISSSSSASSESVNTVAPNARTADHVSPLQTPRQNARTAYALKMTKGGNVQTHDDAQSEYFSNGLGPSLSKGLASAEPFPYRHGEFGPPPPSSPASDEHDH